LQRAAADGLHHLNGTPFEDHVTCKTLRCGRLSDFAAAGIAPSARRKLATHKAPKKKGERGGDGASTVLDRHYDVMDVSSAAEYATLPSHVAQWIRRQEAKFAPARAMYTIKQTMARLVARVVAQAGQQ